MKILLPLLAVLVLAGCGPRFVRPNLTPTATFNVRLDYQTAYQRADAFAWECHGNASVWAWPGFVTDQLFTGSKMGIVRVSGGVIPGPDWAYIKVEAHEQGTRVTVSERDRSSKARRDMAAIVDSIVTGKITCMQQEPESWSPADAPVQLTMTGAHFD